MRTIVLVIALSALTHALAAEEKKAPLAKVRIAGEMTAVRDVVVNNKPHSSAFFATTGGLKFEVKSSSSLLKVYFAATKAKIALITEQTDALRKVIDDKKLDAKGRKKAMDRVMAEYKERGKSTTVAEGELTVADKKLHLSGSARLLDAKKLDKDLPIGGAVVEGEAQVGKFAIGKDKETTLAIKNGTAPIYVTGKAVGDEERKGKLRVYGVLKPGDKGALVLEATKIEAVK